ncbi:MAG: CBS domain-containing protein [Candidatus Gracilibacteria bacterium]
MLAKQIMTKKVQTATTETSVKTIIQKMAQAGVTAIPVVNKNKKLIGIVTEADIATHELNPHTPRAISLLGGLIYLENPTKYNTHLKKFCAQDARDLMTEEVVTINEDTPLAEIIKIMQEKSVGRLPVIDKKGILKGIITRTDIIKALS